MVVDIASRCRFETGSATGGLSAEADRRGEKNHQIHAKIGSRGSISAAAGVTLPVMTTAEGSFSFMVREYAAPDAWNVVAKRPSAKINTARQELRM